MMQHLSPHSDIFHMLLSLLSLLPPQGANDYGQLGLGHTEDVWSPSVIGPIPAPPDSTLTSPSPSPSPPVVVALTGGGGHTMVLLESGRLLACGWNAEGQVGIAESAKTPPDAESPATTATVQAAPPSTRTARPVASTPSDSSGGRNSHPNLLRLRDVEFDPGVRVTRVACGWAHTLAVAGGRHELFGWGSNAHGQLGVCTAAPTARAKRVCVWLPTRIGGLDGVLDVTCGMRHSVIVSSDGRALGWGANRHGQLGLNPSHEPRATEPRAMWPLAAGEGPGMPGGGEALRLGVALSVSAGANHTAILTTAGRVLCCGSNRHGQCGGSAGDIAATSGDTGVAAVPRPPTTTHSASSAARPKVWPARVVAVPGDLTFDEVHCGWTHTVAVASGRGAVWSWGRHHHGQLGHTPVPRAAGAAGYTQQLLHHRLDPFFFARFH